jgi:GTPase SAR1 family protein
MIYNQVIYGKLIGGTTSYQIIAHTSDFKDKLSEIEQNIINIYKFWVIPPNEHKNKKGVVAVGCFKHKFLSDENDYLVIAQVSILPHAEYEDTSYQYRYIFIPQEDLKSIEYKTFYLVNEFMKTEETGQLLQKDPNLSKVDIPLLNKGISENKKLKEVNLIKQCSQEKDNREKSFLFSVLASLINNQRILINHQSNLRSADIYFIVFLLLPMICRTEIAIAFGSFNEKDCNWANLLIKTTRLNSATLPDNCIWLDRQNGNVVGVNSLNNTKYGSKIEYIIRRAIEKNEDQKISQLLEDLDKLKTKQNNLTLQDLKKDIVLIFELPNEKPIRLGIWGTTGSGKTTYLVMLHDRLSKGDSNFEIQTIDAKAQEFLLFHRNQIFQEKVFPTATDPSNKTLNVFNYTVIDSYRIISEAIKLSFIDAPGKFFEDIGERNPGNEVIINTGENQESQEDQEKPKPIYIVDYLISCDGIIFLFDPRRPRNDPQLKPYQNLVPFLFQELKDKAEQLESSKKWEKIDIQTKKLKLYSALCVTKVDDMDEFWQRKEKSQEFVKEVLDQAYQQLSQLLYFDQNYPAGSEQNRSEFFAISSIGRYKENGKELKAVNNPNETETQLSQTKYEYSSPQNSYTINNPEVSKEPDNQSETENLDNSFISAFDDDDDPTLKTPITSEPQTKEKKGSTIKIEKNPEPYQVTKPLEWLIKSIQANQK